MANETTHTLPPERIEAMRNVAAAAHAYFTEYVNLDLPRPLSQGETTLALAMAGVRADGAACDAEEVVKAVPADQRHLTWITSCAMLLKIVHPDPLLDAGNALYSALTDIEMDEPGRWAEGTSKVIGILQQMGYSAGVDEDL